MEKTAMQMAIDWMLSDSFKVENLTRFDVAKKLIELKEVDNTQRIEIFKDGFYQGCDQPLMDKVVDEYFNTKYGKQ